MRELGYVEGKNLAIEWRFAEGEAARLPRLAAELVKLQVDVIVAATPPIARAAQKATATIPIVMVNVADPVAFGLIKSLARPGGNITGTATMISELAPKHLEMLLAVVPKLSRAAVLVHPDDASHAAILENVRRAAQQSRTEILPAEARTASDIESAFSVMTGKNVGAVIVNAGLFSAHRRHIAQLATKHRLPSIAAAVQYAEAGGLMSYGPDIIEPYRRAATYVDKILKGARPGDLPVEQPTRFTLLVNGKSAKALGLTIPPSILVQATRVIE
jgi:putative ABC transport system substrate-binding protein